MIVVRSKVTTKGLPKIILEPEAAFSTSRVLTDETNIEIKNHTWRREKKWLFPDEIGLVDQLLSGKKSGYYFYPAGTVSNPNPAVKNYQIIYSKHPIFGLKDFLPRRRITFLDLGCGGGTAALDIAKEYPIFTVIGIDHALGKQIPFPPHSLPNLNFYPMDWNQLELKSNSIDRIIAWEAIGRYGNTDQAVGELTRVAKPGALFRGTEDIKSMIGSPKFSDRLAAAGWNVYLPMVRPEIVIAQKMPLGRVG